MSKNLENQILIYITHRDQNHLSFSDRQIKKLREIGRDIYMNIEADPYKKFCLPEENLQIVLIAESESDGFRTRIGKDIQIMPYKHRISVKFNDEFLGRTSYLQRCNEGIYFEMGNKRVGISYEPISEDFAQGLDFL